MGPPGSRKRPLEPASQTQASPPGSRKRPLELELKTRASPPGSRKRPLEPVPKTQAAPPGSGKRLKDTSSMAISEVKRELTAQVQELPLYHRGQVLPLYVKALEQERCGKTEFLRELLERLITNEN